MVGPWVCNQFRVDQYIIDVHFEGANPREYYSLFCFPIEISIDGQFSLGRFGKLIWYGIFHHYDIIHKLFELSFHYIMYMLTLIELFKIFPFGVPRKRLVALAILTTFDDDDLIAIHLVLLMYHEDRFNLE